MRKQNLIIYSRSSASLFFWGSDATPEFNKFDPTEFPHNDLLNKCFNALRKKGLKLNADPEFSKGQFKSLGKYRKYALYKGLECKVDTYPTGFKFEFYQNINTGDRKPDTGYYCFDKYKLMPYLVKKRFEYFAHILIETIKSNVECEYSQSDRPMLSEEFVLHSANQSRHKGNPKTLEEYDACCNFRDYDLSQNNNDRDKKKIKNGDVKYFRFYNGRIYRGTVYHNINNMWWIIINKFWHWNVASFQLFDLTDEDLKNRRIKKGAIPEKRQKELAIINSLSVNKLKNILAKKQRQSLKQTS